MVHKHLYFTNAESRSTITVRIITAIFFPAESQLETYIKYMLGRLLGFLKNEKTHQSFRFGFRKRSDINSQWVVQYVIRIFNINNLLVKLLINNFCR